MTAFVRELGEALREAAVPQAAAPDDPSPADVSRAPLGAHPVLRYAVVPEAERYRYSPARTL